MGYYRDGLFLLQIGSERLQSVLLDCWWNVVL